MADRPNSSRRRTASAARPQNTRQPSRSQSTRRRQPDRRRSRQKRGFDLSRTLSRLFPKAEFKPDNFDSGLTKKLFLTQVQRDSLLKWGLYIGLILLLMMIQDVIMSQAVIFGTTTDLAACIILLITVIEGIEVGSLFVLGASCFYYFSGSSPGPYCVAILTVLGIGACLFRQLYWHRNQASIVLCAGLALMLYELSTFAVGIFLELTRWDRLGTFFMKGLISVIVMIPLYNLINRIGQIGGNTWKE